jgi:hypothetical protein
MSTDMNTFNIYCLAKNGELKEQAKIDETKDNFTIKLNDLPYAVQHMDLYLKELFNLMMTYEKEYPYNDAHVYKTKRYEFTNGEYVEATIFHRVFMRKGSYFYVHQESDRGSRFLLYAMNRVHHSSIALGFAMRIPDVMEQRKEMKIILGDHINPLPQYLIGNDSLYFL